MGQNITSCRSRSHVQMYAECDTPIHITIQNVILPFIIEILSRLSYLSGIDMMSQHAIVLRYKNVNYGKIIKLVVTVL